FASLHGFTALSEQAPPDEVMGLLNEFVSAMSEEIFRQDGALEKRGGDSLMAVFGDPVWRPDHSARAMSAAFAMRRRMAALQQDWEAQGHPSIGMGIGLSSGYTVLGATGSPARTDSTVVGGAVNIAARLCELALPGQIVTTRKTYLRVQDVATAAPRERTAVKGFALSVEIMDVLGPLETGPVKTAAPVSLFTTTVGRLLSDTVVAAMVS
ncbi:MAG: adenylate/guanylate cyclase domain-containing protein, partial [Chloroflexi bacterium]|nr:adenylate/guanylate cyclase domain-containing protein [Chloroflexota bacterium]